MNVLFYFFNFSLFWEYVLRNYCEVDDDHILISKISNPENEVSPTGVNPCTTGVFLDIYTLVRY